MRISCEKAGVEYANSHFSNSHEHFKTHRYFGLDFCAVQAECGLLSHIFGFIIDQIIIPTQ